MRLVIVILAMLLASCVGPDVSTVGTSDAATSETVTGDATYEFRAGDPCGPGANAEHCFLNPQGQDPIFLKATRHNWTRLDVNVTWPARASGAQQFFVNLTLDHVPLGEWKVASPFSASFDVSKPFALAVRVFPDVGDAMVDQAVHAKAVYAAPR